MAFTVRGRALKALTLCSKCNTADVKVSQLREVMGSMETTCWWARVWRDGGQGIGASQQ